MTDLILKARLGSLESNFKALSHALASIENRRAEMDQLRNFLVNSRSRITKMEYKLQTIDDRIDNLEGLLDRSLIPDCQEIKKDQKEAGNEAAEVKRNLTNAIAKIREIQARFVDLKDGLDCALDLKRTEEKYNDKRKRISEDLKEAVRAQNIDKAKAEAKRKDAWKKYAETDEMLNPKRVFEEYVDFLRGLAMRDADLDRGICRIADDLTKTWNYLVATQSLTIPASREPANATLAHFVHLGFPEWTLWALPLIAHELGHVVIKKNPKSIQFLKKHAKHKPRRVHWKEFLADAVATLTVGPAYAFACILLRFEPTSAYKDKQERPADAKRAKVIFQILKMYEPTPDVYVEVKNLESEWNNALKQANKASKKLKPEDETELEELLSSLRDEKLLEELTSYVKYPLENNWSRTLTLKEEISDNLNKKPEDQFKVSDWDFKFPDVLNAAWLCRIEELEKTGDIDQAAQATDKIHQTARDLWRALEEYRDRLRLDRGRPSARAETHPRAETPRR